MNSIVNSIFRNRKDVHMKYVDIFQPLEGQGSFDLILHKVNDEITKESKDQKVKEALVRFEVIVICKIAN